MEGKQLQMKQEIGGRGERMKEESRERLEWSGNSYRGNRRKK